MRFCELNRAWAFAALVGLLCIGFASRASAQVPPPFAGFEGEFERAPAPDWVREGMRLSYRSSVTGGQGVIQIDVVAFTGKEAALEMRSFMSDKGLMGPGARLTMGGAAGYATSAGYGGEYWVNPQILRKAAEGIAPGAGIQVFRREHEVLGKKYDAIYFEIKTPTLRTVYSYEEKTGLLIYHSGASINPPPQQSGQPPQGVNYILELMETRQVNLPWREGRPPSWLGKLKKYEYAGSIIHDAPGIGPLPPMPLKLTFSVQTSGPNYVLVEQASSMEGMGMNNVEQSTRVFGSSQAGGLYLPPLALADLAHGQKLDEDSITKAVTSVLHVGRTQYGRDVVTLLEDAPGYALYSDYDRTNGMLLMSTLRNKVLNTSVSVTFVGKE